MTGYRVIRLVKSVRAHRSVPVKTYWVYMLLCADGSFYVGVTNDLELRLGQHTVGIDRRCYTFTRRPLVLVHSSDFHHIDEAIAWEKQLKGWSRAKKAALIENDWPLISQLARNYFGRLCRPSTGSG
jgi:putative endonuclease